MRRERINCQKSYRGTDVSLSQLQRGLHIWESRGERFGSVLNNIEALSHLIDVPRGYGWWRSEESLQSVISQVARLAAKYGPKTKVSVLLPKDTDEGDDISEKESPEFEDLFSDLIEEQEDVSEGESRPKETNEVHEATTQTSNDSHGGDGRSGEVPDGHSLSGEGTSDSRKVAGAHHQGDEDSVNSEGGQSDQGDQRGQGTADPRDGEESPIAESERGVVAAAETGSNSTSQGESSVCEVQGPAMSEEALEDPQQDSGDEADTAKKCEKGSVASDPRSQGSAGKDVASTDRTALNESDTDSERLTDSTDEDNQSDDPNEIGEDGESSENNPQHVFGEANASPKQAMKSLSKLGKSANQSSQQGRDAHGGVTADLRKAKISIGLVARVRSVLASWTADGGQDEQSNRWDYSALSGRLLTKRNPYPARKAELGRPVLLVLADVSGSCAGFSNQSLLVARGIASQGMPGCDVLVVSHSNGFPMEECELNGRPLPLAQHRRYKAMAERKKASSASWGTEGNVAFFEAMIADYNITHVITLGDHDAANVYTMLCEHGSVQQMLWLDNYKCNWQSPGISQPSIQSQAAKAKIRYVVGCKDADGFLVGLRKALG